MEWFVDHIIFLLLLKSKDANAEVNVRPCAVEVWWNHTFDGRTHTHEFITLSLMHFDTWHLWSGFRWKFITTWSLFCVFDILMVCKARNSARIWESILAIILVAFRYANQFLLLNYVVNTTVTQNLILVNQNEILPL